eukprot:CAMPEP_0194198592 /NCGR_PEP_ID=MMETSP0154-20130528/77851_1 /TAXON_ID=1049557 /ORGANISM="Thalassiothrix antarctica, Strain L6-D1" /LENGTH=183 /DNA_ID=CAMNT_0038923401 /DNA_START=756 /DNA_END=1304 /DNA_ORIENTATION=-
MDVIERFNTTDERILFRLLSKASSFSAAAKGTNLFSYRFSEVMSCGSIPVVYADDWMLPFGSSLVDWREIAVIIREEDVFRSEQILSSIPPKQVCRMRRNMIGFFRTYMETGRGIIRGIIDTFELQANGTMEEQQPQQQKLDPLLPTEYYCNNKNSNTTATTTTTMNGSKNITATSSPVYDKA